MTTIIATGANASASLRYLLPFDDISYLNFFTGADVLARNLGTGDAPTVVGSPAQGSGFATFSPSAYLDLGAGDTDNITLFAVMQKVSSGTTAAAIGNYRGIGGLGLTGANIYSDTAEALSGSVGQNNAGAGAAALINLSGNPLNWNAVSLRVGVTEDHGRVQNLTAGTSLTMALQYTRYSGVEYLRVGSLPAVANGPMRIAMAAVINRYIADDELADLYARARYVANLSGIAV